MRSNSKILNLHKKYLIYGLTALEVYAFLINLLTIASRITIWMTSNINEC